MLFYEIPCVCFYSINDKRLPSKVTLLSLVLNVYFIGFQLFSEGKLYLSTSLNPFIALHIEATLLADSTHELLPKLVNEQPEAQINLTEDKEDLNVNPKSESELHEVQSTSRN